MGRKRRHDLDYYVDRHDHLVDLRCINGFQYRELHDNLHY